jgi:hypothetical protein
VGRVRELKEVPWLGERLAQQRLWHVDERHGLGHIDGRPHRGWTDIAISLVILAFAIGVYRNHGALLRMATSRFAQTIFGYAAFYEFVNAVFHAGLFTAAGTFYPKVWDVVERGSNFLVPAALL